MAQPIQQLTRNNHSQERESVPFTVISRKEKFGKVLYEKRRYEKGKWACVKVHKEQYEQSVCLGFMKIMQYICEQNSSESKARYVGRGFGGVTNEDSIAREISLLAELLERPELCLQDTFIVAGYTNPAAATRQNEIWFLERS